MIPSDSQIYVVVLSESEDLDIEARRVLAPMSRRRAKTPTVNQPMREVR
jgi:hypothetical protein